MNNNLAHTIITVTVESQLSEPEGTVSLDN